MYQSRFPATSEFVRIRTLNAHLRHWHSQQAGTPLVMLHGWMDVGASFQFVVDALTPSRPIIAPDWRGYGLTRLAASNAHTDSYWFADYVADLDAMLEHISPIAPVDLCGHSMGGNVVMMYAGIRPKRVRRLINLEGFGMPKTDSAQSPTRLLKWLDELKSFRAGDMALKSYDSADGVARRLMKNNQRLREDRAQWLAQHWGAPDAHGRWHILGDAAHKLVNPSLHRVEETLATYQRIEAPTLVVVAEHSQEQFAQWWQGRYTLAEFHERLQSVPQLQTADLANAGHMLHHDQPEALARIIEQFLAAD